MKKSLTGVLLSLILPGGFVPSVVSVLAADEATETQLVEVAEDEPVLSEKMIAVFFVEGENEILPGGFVYLKEGGSINISAKHIEGYEPVKIKISYGFSGYEVEGSTLTINYEDVKMMTHIFIYVVYRKTTPPSTDAPKTEEPKATPPASEAPKVTEQPKSETPNSTSPSAEAPKAEEPKVTPPATTKPGVTPPTTEAPKVTEQPKSEVPKSTLPATEAPKTAEQPKSEEPKTAEQKKALPNTGEAPSVLATIGAILLGFVGLIGFNYKQEN